MKKLIYLLIGFALSFGFADAQQSKKTQNTNLSAFEAEIQKDIEGQKIAGAAYLLYHKGEIIRLKAFGDADVVVWVDTIKEGRFEDTNKLWEDPQHYDHRIEVTGDDYLDSLPTRAITVVRKFGLTDWKEDTVLLLGRYQPWHEGHRALYEEAKKRAYQVVIGVRHTSGMTPKDPLHFHEVKQHILNDVPDAFVVKMPNITNIVYGRDVGYKIEQVDLGADIHAISATQKRKEMGI